MSIVSNEDALYTALAAFKKTPTARNAVLLAAKTHSYLAERLGQPVDELFLDKLQLAADICSCRQKFVLENLIIEELNLSPTTQPTAA